MVNTLGEPTHLRNTGAQEHHQTEWRSGEDLWAGKGKRGSPTLKYEQKPGVALLLSNDRVNKLAVNIY